MADSEQDTGANPNPLDGAHVLVVDDEEDSRAFLTMVLEDEGAVVSTAAGGDQALEAVHGKRFDAMTLDLEMPGRNGIEVFTEMRESEGLEDLPVCIVTGHPDLRALIYERAVRPPEGFLTKPVEPEALVSILRRILALRHRRSRREDG